MGKQQNKNKKQQNSSKTEQNNGHLTDKQARFVSEYLKDMNATQAYKRAGYQVKSDEVAGASARRMLRNVTVRTAIKEEQKIIREKNRISTGWVLDRLKDNVERCMQLEPVRDKEGNVTGVYKWEPQGANKGLELIGKHIGMFIERVEHTEKQANPLANVPTEQLKKLLETVKAKK
jgi:phage terminase small subunit